MLLEPNNRLLLTQAFRAPAGYRFDYGIATTYSLDLTSLLSATLRLSIFGEDDATEEYKDSIALLEALRRTTSRLAVFCQAGQTGVPGTPHVLYGLLEPIVIPVTAPLGGVFHPKIWALRFVPVDPDDSVLLRLLVLSRNLTNDRCWDIALALEGSPTSSAKPHNRGLGDLVDALPELGRRISEVSDLIAVKTHKLAEDLLTADWQLPEGFEKLRFDALGLTPRKWHLPKSDRLAVVSPFCTSEALSRLADSTRKPALLISRSEDLDVVDSAVTSLFSSCMVLRERAETEDGEDKTEQPHALCGLHAKVYIGEEGAETRITFGSANATNAALLQCHNVELLAELLGKRRQIGGIDDLLSPSGFGKLLEPYSPGEQMEPDEDLLEAQRQLEEARSALSTARLRLCCDGEKDAWNLHICPVERLDFQGLSSVKAWPITLHPDSAVEVCGLASGEAVALPTCSLAAVTGFIAFELSAARAPETCRFVLNLPVEGLPVERRAAVVRTIVASREGFLKYLMFLLADFEEDGLPNEILAAVSGSGRFNGYPLEQALPLLEEMTRALSRDPDKLRSIESLIRDLASTKEGEEMIPAEFLDLWKVYESLLPEVEK